MAATAVTPRAIPVPDSDSAASPSTVLIHLPSGKQIQVQVHSNQHAACVLKRAVQSMEGGDLWSFRLVPVLRSAGLGGDAVVYTPPHNRSSSSHANDPTEHPLRKLPVESDNVRLPMELCVRARHPPPAPKHQVVVRLMSEQEIEGVDQFTLDVDMKDTILDVKFMLEQRTKVPAEYMRLYVRYARTPKRVLLPDTQTIESTRLCAGPSMVHSVRLMFELDSGEAGHGSIHTTAINLRGPGMAPAQVTSDSEPGTSSLDQNLVSMGGLWMRAVKKYSNKPFLGTRSFIKKDGSDGSFERGAYEWQSYGEVGDRVLALSAGLRHLGMKVGDKIGIISQNRSEWVCTDMACCISGLVSVPLYDTLGKDAVTYIINHAEVRCVVASVKDLAGIAAVRQKCPSLEMVIAMDDQMPDKQKLDVMPSANPALFNARFSEVEEMGRQHLDAFTPQMTKAEDIHCICYTSGTTGNPKGAVITHGNMVSACFALDARAPEREKSPDDSVLSYLPLAHIYERVVQSMMMLNGAAIGFAQGDVTKILEDIQALRPTFFPGVPRVWQRIYDRVTSQAASSGLIKSAIFNRAISSKVHQLESGDIDRDGKLHSVYDRIVFSKIAANVGGRVKLMSTGAAPLSPRVAAFMRAAFCTAFAEGYGMTESAAALTVSAHDDTYYGHVGTPLDCCLVKLVNVDDMQYFVTDKPCPRGEIWVSGPNVFREYYKQPDVTAECIATDKEGRRWLMTGDVGMWLPDGNLKIIDRKKNLFKMAQGEYIAPEKIEGVYKQCQAVANIFVTGIGTETFLVAIVVPDPEALKAFCEKEGINLPAATTSTISPSTSANNVTGPLIADPRIMCWIRSSMSSMGRREGLKGFEQVKNVRVITNDFSVESGLLTPTLKLKRNVAQKVFEELIQQMYKQGPVEESDATIEGTNKTPIASKL